MTILKDVILSDGFPLYNVHETYQKRNRIKSLND